MRDVAALNTAIVTIPAQNPQRICRPNIASPIEADRTIFIAQVTSETIAQSHFRHNQRKCRQLTSTAMQNGFRLIEACPLR